MPSTEHEAVVRLFHESPALAAGLLQDALHVPLPDYDYVGLESGDLTETTPSELRADSVIVFQRKRPDADPEPVLAVVVEVQRARDPGKHWTWPMYLVALRTRMRCPAVLLVVCPEAAIARWSARPIDLGHPNLTLVPLVAGPTEVPEITDVREAAQDLELAVLSMITHAEAPGAADIANALFTAIHDIDPDRGGLYADMVRAALSREVWDHLEKQMKTETREYLSDWVREKVVKGKAEAIAESIFRVLAARGVEVPEEVRAEISACTDLEQLDAWVGIAATADSARALLD
ncbi:hypothetical protein DPM19_07550 [Actinomadura craniellae]|uniref:Transposase (putative) YhgA-like domain-containing protein n=1 Tax=Actinomadura craniellae TaxID=2231787 RepID=A0A365H9F5_9ACTN|nr:hypothetical protein [Actinomadura craniellae]RAY15638.1 hypothetical protein DPM19_07550 [Actinomadura craniellae]